MKRYYICDIYGNGDIDVENTPTTGPFRPAVADLGVPWVGAIPTHPEGHPDQGKPIYSWALVMVAGNDHAKVRAAQSVDSLPDFPLDGKVNAINQGTKRAMDAVLSRRGIASVSGADGYRDVIRGIGRALEASFDENKFDIADS